MIDDLLGQRRLSSASLLIVFLIYMKIPCYSSWTYLDSLENSSENFLNDDHNITLEKTFPNFIITDYHTQNYSEIEEYKKADYPYKKILDAIMSSKAAFNSGRLASFFPPTALAPRMGSSSIVKYHAMRAEESCKEIISRIKPIKGKGVDGKNYFITNVKGFMQVTDAIICHKRGSLCDEDAAPEDHASRCEQQYAFVELSTFPETGNITAESQSVKTFKVPSGCSCKRHRVRDNM